MRARYKQRAISAHHANLLSSTRSGKEAIGGASERETSRKWMLQKTGLRYQERTAKIVGEPVRPWITGTRRTASKFLPSSD